MRALLRSLAADILHAVNDNGDTPLHAAASAGELACLRLLVGRGAPLVPNSAGSTPLHLVAELGDPACLRYLLEQGADVDAPNADGDSALHVAASVQREGQGGGRGRGRWSRGE